MPPEARSYYDSFGDSVAMCVRYDLGRVCYLAQVYTHTHIRARAHTHIYIFIYALRSGAC
jgi:hypothetical protein